MSSGSYFDTLLSHIEHVNEVVASQQTYATNVAFTVKENPVSIIESSIQITSERFRQLNVSIERHFEPLGEAMLDRSKLLQILVNILKNAALSIDDSGKEERIVTVRLSPCDEGMMISIVDTGVGISKENLKIIFQHGFTTRSNRGGHGFGLHHCANAIAEMGGRLAVDSPGEMLGATFSIILPLKKPQEDSQEYLVTN